MDSEGSHDGYKSGDNRAPMGPPSVFWHDRTEALDPSLVKPTPPLAQQNNILYMQDIGKEYQLAVKDFNVRVRDNRIVAKDQEILYLREMEERQDEELKLLRANIRRLQYILQRQNDQLIHQTIEVRNMETDMGLLGATTFAQAQEILEQDYKLRLLQKELQAARAENQNLKDQRLIDQLLRWIRTPLGSTTTPSQPCTMHFPFLALPGELRISIYKYALVSGRPIDLWPIKPLDAPRGTTHLTILIEDIKDINVSLVRVSRQVHKEATSVLYGCNRFRFSDRYGWTILSGFLDHIKRNCDFLTHISVRYPEWSSNDYSEFARSSNLGRSPHPDPLVLKEMRVLLRRFGGTILDSPVGPSRDFYTAYRRAGYILIRLPNLKSFNIIVPHAVSLVELGVGCVSQILTADDPHHVPYNNWVPPANPRRSFIMIRRDVQMQRNLFGFVDVDDEIGMGRARLSFNCMRNGAEVKYARYGQWNERVSYAVDGDEEIWEPDIPKDAQGSMGLGMRAWSIVQAVRHRLGY